MNMKHSFVLRKVIIIRNNIHLSSAHHCFHSLTFFLCPLLSRSLFLFLKFPPLLFYFFTSFT
ncbi:hypothetical protein BDV39DRAFT_185955 [Aspergillus sergii]|uniref:Uncharacterized protein n=1 Tax=Aspergillus sergii TaxID=1034303 RepID=A0A5N6WPC8_9EURO|nr:hypothetical protein BDV39DRAFT_185955 [Aspergillus sergii]